MTEKPNVSTRIAERHAEVLGQAPRIAPVDRDVGGAEVQAVSQRLRGGVVGDAPPLPIEDIPEIMFTMCRYPDLWQRIMDLSIQIQGPSSTLPMRDRKLAILRTAWLCEAPYVFGEHVNQSKRVGLTTAEIEDIIVGSTSARWTAHERAVLRAAEELRTNAMVTDDTWHELSKTFSDAQIVELLVLIGQFTATAYFQNAMRLRLEADNLGLAGR